MRKLIISLLLLTIASPAFAKEYTVKMVTVPGPDEIYRFEPDKLTIQQGDTVTFVNVQDDEHNVMFEEVPEGADFATSPMLKKEGEKWSHTFTKEGSYKYHCHPHADWGMEGTIIVGKPSLPEAQKIDEHHHHHHHDKMNMDHHKHHEGEHADTQEAHEEHAMSHAGMKGYYGSYSMTREASGTAWLPESSPMEGIHGMYGDWMTMVHGYANLIYDHQGGDRGGDKTFSESMFMVMATRPAGEGTLGLRSMVSLDPLMGKAGYPLLLQTGETANGVDPLIDRQHPHDMLMELAATYSHPVDADSSAFVYVGYPGEPALGPATFMHRFSGMDNPEAPITHHWLDSTHVTFGVATLGYIWRDWKVEASAFKGREPDQYRWNFDSPKLNSYSGRLTYNPTANWSMQVSHGKIKSPEALEPDVDQHRTTASVTYNRPLAEDNWQTTLAWGLNNNSSPGHATHALLLESAYSLHDTHTFFGRAEYVGKDELFEAPSPLAGQVFNVGKLSAGYVYDIPVAEHVKIGLGGVGSVYALPDRITSAYGDSPASAMAFVRIKLK